MHRLVLVGAAAIGLMLGAGLPAQAQTEAAKPPPPGMAVATFAGGCFWCMEAAFDPVKGVQSTVSGYTGGHKANPTYYEVGSGRTGHAEAVRVVYDPKQVSYDTLLDTFWHNIDPVDPRGQFCDKGTQYRPEIFVHDEAQKKAAEASKAALEKSGRFKQPIVVKITAAGPFYVAEDYHQDYYIKNPVRYKFYRYNCGRDARLQQVWGAAPTH
jgi:peptide-methionine (S)-S-oxide reductase